MKGFADAEALVIRKKSATKFVCRVYVIQLVLLIVLLIIFRNKFHVLFNTAHGSDSPRENDTDFNLLYLNVEYDTWRNTVIEADDNLLEMEMSVDENFDGEMDEITIGAFVSFKYMGNNAGIPMSPKVSSGVKQPLLLSP